MEVIKRGKRQTPWTGKKVTCISCGAKIKLEEGDELKLVPDRREGDYYEFDCPECGSLVTVAAHLFSSSLIE